MQTTRRLLILGAATLAGAAQAQPPPPVPTPGRSPAEPLSLSALLAAGRGALASSVREA